MRESAKRILALVLSFVMIFTSLPVIASAKNNNDPTYLSLDGPSTMYVGETATFKAGDENNNSYNWTAEPSDLVSINVTKDDASITALKAGVVVIYARHDNSNGNSGKPNYSLSVTISGNNNNDPGNNDEPGNDTPDPIVPEKETITENVEVKWGERYTLKDIKKDLTWTIKEQNKIAQIPGKNTTDVAHILEEEYFNVFAWKYVYDYTYVVAHNIGTITFTAEDNDYKYVVNVEVITDDEENIDIYVGEEYSLGSRGIILKNDAKLYDFKILDETIARGRIDNDGFLKDKTYIVTGLSEGTTYLWKKYTGPIGLADGNEYVFKINVNKRPYFKNIEYTVNEGVPSAVIKTQNQNGIVIDESATISTNFADYKDNFETSYEDDNFTYTLNEELSEVTVSEFDDNNTKTVSVKANYTIAKKYKQVVYVELLAGDAINVSRKEALKEGYVHNSALKSYTFTETIEEESEVDVTKYIKDTFNYNGKSYELNVTDTKVVTGQFNDNNVREVKITPAYREGKHISVDYKVSFKTPEYAWGRFTGKYKEEAGQKVDSIDDLFISTDEFNKLTRSANASNVGKYLDADHNYQFVDAEFKNNKLTIYVAAQRYKLFTQYEGQRKAEGKNEWTYVVREKEDKNFAKMSDSELKEYFDVKDIVLKDETTYQLTKMDKKCDYDTQIELTLNYAKASYLAYKASFVSNDETIKADTEVFYVLDRKNDYFFTQAKEDKENIEKIIKDNKLDADIEDEESNKEIYKFVEYKVGKAVNNVTPIILSFKKEFKKPINVKHVLHFEGKDVKVVSEEVESALFDKNGKEIAITFNGVVTNAYRDAYALEGYTLDYKFLGLNCVSYDKKSNTLTFRYWAKKITVAKAGTYKVMVPASGFMWTYKPEHEEDRFFNPMKDYEVIYLNYNEIGKLDYNKNTYKNITLSDGTNIYDGFTSADKLYSVNKVNITLDFSLLFQEHNSALIVLTYGYDVQGNCKHEDEDVEYIDNEDGKTHKVVCTDCKKVLDEKEAHEWNEAHVCEKCGAKDEAWMRSIEVSIELPAGVISYDYETLYNYVLTNAPGKISSLIKGLEEEEIAALAEKGEQVGIVDDEDAEESIEALHEHFNAYVNMPNEDKLKYVVKDVELESDLGYLYNVSINVNKVAGKFNQIEIKNNLNQKEISDMILNQVRTQNNISPDYLGMVTVLTDEPLAYGSVYEVIVNIGANIEKEFYNNYKFTGKMHLYTGSGKNKNKNKKNENLNDDLLPQGGAGIADLRNNRPNDMLTRSEFIGVLSELFTVLDTENYKEFNDISGDANELAIKKLSSFGIIQGYCDQTFGPNDYITREQMYTFIARALKFSGKASGLTDEQIDAALAKVLDGVNVADWAEEGVAISIEKELVNEDEKAQDTIKRVEAADKLEKFAAILYSSEEKAE